MSRTEESEKSPKPETPSQSRKQKVSIVNEKPNKCDDTTMSHFRYIIISEGSYYLYNIIFILFIEVIY